MLLLSFQVMGKNKILVKVHPEGKYVVDLHKDIDINKVTTGKLFQQPFRCIALLSN